MTAVTGHANGYDTGTGHAVLEPGRTPDVLLAEKHVLGSAIASRLVAEAMTGMLPAIDYFGSAVHRAVYAAVRYLAEETAETICEATVLARLVATEQGLWRTGQAGVVLAEFVRYATPSWESYARRVLRETMRRRGLLATDQAGQMLAEAADDDLGEVAKRVRALFDAALGGMPSAAGAVTAAELFDSVVSRWSPDARPGRSRCRGRTCATARLPAPRPADHDRRPAVARQVGSARTSPGTSRSSKGCR